MRIGEAARRSGFAVRTIRFYERRGLLMPAAPRPHGYRPYTHAETQRPTVIRQGKGARPDAGRHPGPRGGLRSAERLRHASTAPPGARRAHSSDERPAEDADG